MNQISRLQFAHLPTPVEELPRLSEALNGPRILIKRDDQTGHRPGAGFQGTRARNASIAATASGSSSRPPLENHRPMAVAGAAVSRVGSSIVRGDGRPGVGELGPVSDICISSRGKPYRRFSNLKGNLPHAPQKRCAPSRSRGKQTPGGSAC